MLIEKKILRYLVSYPSRKRFLTTCSLKRTHSNYMNASSVLAYVDYDRCKGNYIYDTYGKKYLDMFCQIATLPLGYNHPKLVNWAKNIDYKYLINRPSLGLFPDKEFVNNIENGLMTCAPKGLNNVVLTTEGGSGAIENVIKMCIYNFHKERNAFSDISSKTLEDFLYNKGNEKCSILTLDGGFHGRTLGCLSATHTDPLYKYGLPAFNWPTAPFPIVNYPLEKNEKENKDNETKCLEKIENVILQQRNNGKDVAGLIVEPIQAEGGDRQASNNFYKYLREIAYNNNILFVVDEVQTGFGGTGKFWAHEWWNLNREPDAVVFSKRMQVAGFFTKSEYRCDHPKYIFSTWLGDPLRLKLLTKILKIVREDKLIEKVDSVGLQLMSELEKLGLNNVRGKGTMIAFDVDDSTQFQKACLENGLILGICGKNTVRLRPSLLVDNEVSSQFIDLLKKSK